MSHLLCHHLALNSTQFASVVRRIRLYHVINMLSCARVVVAAKKYSANLISGVVRMRTENKLAACNKLHTFVDVTKAAEICRKSAFEFLEARPKAFPPHSGVT